MAKSNSSVTTIDDEQPAAEAASEMVQPMVVGTNHDDQLSGKRKMVTIYEGHEDGGSEAVFVSINGYAYQIPRGKPCNVPAEVISVLSDAVVTTMSNSPGGAIVQRSIPRYNFQVG